MWEFVGAHCIVHGRIPNWGISSLSGSVFSSPRPPSFQKTSIFYHHSTSIPENKTGRFKGFSHIWKFTQGIANSFPKYPIIKQCEVGVLLHFLTFEYPVAPAPFTKKTPTTFRFSLSSHCLVLEAYSAMEVHGKKGN